MSLQLSANPAKTKLRTAVSKQNWRPTQATHRHRQISRLRRGSLVIIQTAVGQYAATDIERSGSKLVVKSNDPRPLQQALLALTQQFGWNVDYEDPVYSPSESSDISVPKWRKLHPNEVGFLAPSGGSFVATLEELDNMEGRGGTALRGLVDQYNKTTNPGKFRVSKTSRGRWSVIGSSRAKVASDPLDVMTKPDPQADAAIVALRRLINNCAKVSGVKMTIGTAPINILSQSIVQGHLQMSSCRDQLADILDSLPRPFVYHLLYDIGSATYAWNIVPVTASH